MSRGNNIYVIVENVEMMTHEDYPGQEEIVEVIRAREGYFIDENSAETRVNALNARYYGQHPNEDTLEKWETRFGYIPLEPKGSMSYEVQREPITKEALKKAKDGELTVILAIDFEELACISSDGTLDGLNCWIDDTLFAYLGVASDYRFKPLAVEGNEILFEFNCDVSDLLAEILEKDAQHHEQANWKEFVNSAINFRRLTWKITGDPNHLTAHYGDNFEPPSDEEVSRVTKQFDQQLAAAAKEFGIVIKM